MKLLLKTMSVDGAAASMSSAAALKQRCGLPSVRRAEGELSDWAVQAGLGIGSSAQADDEQKSPPSGGYESRTSSPRSSPFDAKVSSSALPITS
jgi:hypothetical protein